jgi:hypothetical protein
MKTEQCMEENRDQTATGRLMVLGMPDPLRKIHQTPRCISHKGPDPDLLCAEIQSSWGPRVRPVNGSFSDRNAKQTFLFV